MPDDAPVMTTVVDGSGAGRLMLTSLSPGLAAPLLGGDVGDRLRERPLVAGEVLGVVLALAVFEVRRLHDDACAVRASLRAVHPGVLHAHDHPMRRLPWPRGAAAVADVDDDERAVAELHLRPVVGPDEQAEPEAERGGQPLGGFAHVR